MDTEPDPAIPDILTSSIMEPYRSAFVSLADITQLLDDKLSTTYSSASAIQRDLQDLPLMVVCLSKIMESILCIAPQLASTQKVFCKIESQIHEDVRSLGQLKVDIKKSAAFIRGTTKSGFLRTVLHRISVRWTRWPALCRRVELFVRSKREWLERTVWLLAK